MLALFGHQAGFTQVTRIKQLFLAQLEKVFFTKQHFRTAVCRCVCINVVGLFYRTFRSVKMHFFANLIRLSAVNWPNRNQIKLTHAT